MLDSVAMTIFEVSALSTQHIHVALEHPHEDSMITVEFDLTSVAAVQCKITPSSPVNEQVSTRLSKVAQASLSIPMVMRALVRAFAETEQLAPHKPVPGHGSNLMRVLVWAPQPRDRTQGWARAVRPMLVPRPSRTRPWVVVVVLAVVASSGVPTTYSIRVQR